MDRRVVRAFCAGVLTANTIPHAYAASVGAMQLTPLRGRKSGPVLNAAWAGINAAGALALARPLDPASATHRRAFKAGACAFTAWALLSEWVTDFNG